MLQEIRAEITDEDHTEQQDNKRPQQQDHPESSQEHHKSAADSLPPVTDSETRLVIIATESR